jgi:hypothetical protein
LALEKVVAKKSVPKQEQACLVVCLLHDVANNKRGQTATLMAALATATPLPPIMASWQSAIATAIFTLLGTDLIAPSSTPVAVQPVTSLPGPDVLS